MTSSLPFFSICIPTYNRAHMLLEAIESVLSQDFNDYELVVVDNNSTDGTQGMLEKYNDSRIRVIRNPQTVSMYANHNICVKYAQAKWIVFLHSDDIMLPGALRTLYQYTTSHSNTNVFFPAHHIHLPYVSDGPVVLKGIISTTSLLRWRTGAPTGVLYARDTLVKHRFDEETLCADFGFLIQVLMDDGVIMIVPEKIVHVRTGKHQASRDVTLSRAAFLETARLIRYAVRNQTVTKHLILDIVHWEKREISGLLVALAHADCKELINVLEHRLSKRADYKRDFRNYWQVMVYCYLGPVALSILFNVYLKLRCLWVSVK